MNGTGALLELLRPPPAQGCLSLVTSSAAPLIGGCLFVIWTPRFGHARPHPGSPPRRGGAASVVVGGMFPSAFEALSNAAKTMDHSGGCIALPLLGERAGGEGGPPLINHDEKMHPLSLRPLPGLWPCEQLGPLNSASLFFSSLHFICYAGVPMVDLKSGASVWAWLAAWMPVKPEVKGMKYGEFAKGN